MRGYDFGLCPAVSLDLHFSSRTVADTADPQRAAVRRGERRSIFPACRNADVVLATTFRAQLRANVYACVFTAGADPANTNGRAKASGTYRGRRRLILRPIRFARLLPVDANRPRRSRL